MKIKPQYKLSPFSVKSIVGSAFNRECTDSREASIETLRKNRGLGNEEFTAILRSLILDPTHTWTQKADDWTGDKRETEEENEAFCRYIWEVVSEGQPWPLDEAKK